jgi:hypothetical protein
MSGGIGLNIAAADYNSIQAKVASVLRDTVGGQRGYGLAAASLNSSPVGLLGPENITKVQWDRLRADILNIKLHQDGVYPPIVTLGINQVVGYGAGNPNTNYDSLADNTIANKFNIGEGQSLLTIPTVANQTSPGTIIRSGAWSSLSQCTLTVSFNGYTRSDATVVSPTNHARYFFNSGGKIRFSSSRTGGSSTPQNNAWTNLLNSIVGGIAFGAQTPSIANFYTLTNSYQPIYQLSSSSPYSSNFYLIEALCNCSAPTNVNGTASTVTFRFSWRDNYVDPGQSAFNPQPDNVDSVNGTLSLMVEELRATGVMFRSGDSQTNPTGTFLIIGPSTYSFTAISAS